jgi:large subunit ribosomal protein L19
MNPIIKEITASQVKNDIPPFKVGDGVRVHTKVREGDKERIQIFSGIVIARKGHGHPRELHGPQDQLRRGRRARLPGEFPEHRGHRGRARVGADEARLYYLRNRTGKAAVAVKVKTRRTDQAAATPAAS